MAAQTVLKACQELGFFLLDLRDDEVGDTLIGEIDQLFTAGPEVFGLPDNVKKDYVHDAPRSFQVSSHLGLLKPRHRNPIASNGSISEKILVGIAPPQRLPPQISEHLPLFISFLHHGQRVVSTISSVLAAQLGLPVDAFTSLQRLEQPSGTVMRLIKAYSSIDQSDLRTSMIHHTDFGTITLLANIVGGLQILAPGARAEDPNAWTWVRPRPGHLIVNLGDAMVQWSGGLLRSNVHRINHAPGLQRSVDRYSLALLARPERDASMKRLVGLKQNGVREGKENDEEDITAWEWEVKKTMSYTRGEAVVQSTGGVVKENQ